MENESSFEREWSEILSGIEKLGNIAIKAHENAYLGMKTKDRSCFVDALDEAAHIRELTVTLDNKIISTIGTYLMKEGDFRESIALLKITNDYERIGNAARKFSRDIQKYMQDSFIESKTYNYILELYEATIAAIKAANSATIATDSMFDYDECLKKAVIEESKTDDLFSMIHKEIIFTNYQDEIVLRHTIELFNSIRRLERAADHAVNIIKLMIYAKKGGLLGE